MDFDQPGRPRGQKHIIALGSGQAGWVPGLAWLGRASETRRAGGREGEGLGGRAGPVARGNVLNYRLTIRVEIDYS